MNRLGCILGLLLASPAAVWAGCAPDQVEIRLTNGGMARFSVEVADDPAERAKGLMFREEMASSAGMVFFYERPQHAVFWMKNTLIPLDMIFADSTGLVKHVHANAIPHDETGIDGGTDILAILEINGGLAKKLGITAGSVMRHPDFKQNSASWPCDAK
ncbi:DUF192 domain-containing protein [Pseudorhodobacter sp. W20_MBD10_FR17]|uniref:DUF192 domain-containing protein n=1 Tax=Pseudorhodobacter sp. W20_MBD10_FR17 TaxID=3240266 RepID=UPI003F95B6E2